MPLPEGSPAEEAQESPAAEGQEQAKGQGDQADPVKVMSTVQSALSGIAQAVQGSKQIPAEAQKHIENAMNEYNAFMKIVGSSMGVPMGQDQSSMGNQDPAAAGNRGAVPADQPMRPGAKPMMG